MANSSYTQATDVKKYTVFKRVPFAKNVRLYKMYKNGEQEMLLSIPTVAKTAIINRTFCCTINFLLDDDILQ